MCVLHSDLLSSLCALIVCPPKVGWHVFQLRPWWAEWSVAKSWILQGQRTVSQSSEYSIYRVYRGWLVGWKQSRQKTWIRRRFSTATCPTRYLLAGIQNAPPMSSLVSLLPRPESQGTANGVRLLTVQSSLGFCSRHQGMKELNGIEFYKLYT